MMRRACVYLQNPYGVPRRAFPAVRAEMTRDGVHLGTLLRYLAVTSATMADPTWCSKCHIPWRS